MPKHFFLTLALLTTAFCGTFASESAATTHQHPNLVRSEQHLDDAIDFLTHAPAIFNGHRVQAIEACQTAKREIHQAFEYAAQHPEEVAKTHYTPSERELDVLTDEQRAERQVLATEFHAYPRLATAFANLDRTIAYLDGASRVLGGNRMRALAACREAKEQIKQALLAAGH